MNDEIVSPIVKVWTAVIVANAISLADILHIAQIGSLAVATGYTLWKWHRDSKKKNQKEENE